MEVDCRLCRSRSPYRNGLREITLGLFLDEECADLASVRSDSGGRDVVYNREMAMTDTVRL